MRRCIHRLLLGLAFTSLTLLGCGNTKSAANSDGGSSDRAVAANPDGGPSDVAVCKGEPISCAQGGPSGTGVSCGGLRISGACVGGVWTCPKGMVDWRDCTCGEPGLSCLPQVCTPTGPVCLDAGAGADADAGHDALVDSILCADASFFYCAQGARNGDIGICDDVATPAGCVGGQWTCPTGAINTGLCTCSGVPPMGCTCTSHGWSCDAGAPIDGPADASDGH